MQNRFKSWVLWIAIASLIGFILKTYFKIEIPQFDFLVTSVMSILVMLGIVNNPTDNNKI